MNDAHARLFEPALHAFNGLPDRKRALMQSRIGTDAHEGGEHGPAQTDWRGAAELLVPPRPCSVVMFRKTVFCAKEQVRVKEGSRVVFSLSAGEQLADIVVIQSRTPAQRTSLGAVTSRGWQFQDLIKPGTQRRIDHIPERLAKFGRTFLCFRGYVRIKRQRSSH
jgi:hypothetical protein